VKSLSLSLLIVICACSAAYCGTFTSMAQQKIEDADKLTAMVTPILTAKIPDKASPAYMNARHVAVERTRDVCEWCFALKHAAQKVATGDESSAALESLSKCDRKLAAAIDAWNTAITELARLAGDH
jgi:hypothetical protein